MQPVRKGTHGGVTLLGLTGAAAGGLLAGAVFYCAAVLSPTLWVFEAQVRAAAALCDMTEMYIPCIPCICFAVTSGSLEASVPRASLFHSLHWFCSQIWQSWNQQWQGHQ
jgi:hypothetical protein